MLEKVKDGGGFTSFRFSGCTLKFKFKAFIVFV